MEEVSITPANVNDGKAGPGALPDNPGEVFADSAYRGRHFDDAVRAKGGTPRVVATGLWGRIRAKRWRALMPGTGPSIGYETGSRKSSGAPFKPGAGYGSEAMAFAACDGQDWPRLPSRFGSPAIAYNKRGLTIVAAADDLPTTGGCLRP